MRGPGASRRSLIDSRLWRYGRHPNYFGEAVQWIGIALLGVAAGSWWSLLSPAMMLIILLRMTGVRLMEQRVRGEHPLHERVRANAQAPWSRMSPLRWPSASDSATRWK